MKFWHCCTKLGFIVLFLSSIRAENALAALPLQVGVYHGGGSRYIQIAEKQNRICFKGFSSNGVTVASVTADTKRENFYKINKFEGGFLLQQDKDTLLFGPVNESSKYVADYGFPRNLDNDLQECLNSQKPFFKQKSGGRGSR
ncbi:MULTISPECIES: hypothetical protein [unclassified Microcoleus]|uniref:hypothetical protein n=1 Tax=unclassified Microcoleus TaxID=2642155 RepID=UPI001D5901DA|nr:MULTISPECIES: hypothetical protein [unclassified Microcoleus]MCC3440233.1 hypothetical protein [Microcoleus sp. PH2017_03_ELD_O_A]MCC3501501.1 hypothetical protein [Microcoleus sp. PH2017_19_SFW_U_A]TAG15997.1 MAG: hypothetical protein EAZ39_18410 [Oscillatoriales cyanobacterium]MCC3434245.1 hypothetical protein [Microcoleus sp. PH2017_05_CCC_O_A]MCC3520605.1 hypothetical protein [Microcoleus sp. PH2017_20_SFW_D_A]